ncbi:unnamed protein product [Discula destructiva]
MQQGHNGLPFATIDTAEAIFNYDNVQLLYQSLTGPDLDADDDDFQIGKRLFLERVRTRKLHTFLAVLIYARGDILAARTFVRKLVVPELWPLPENGTNLLPADRTWLKNFFGEDDFVTAQEFFAKQASFCTVVLRKRREIIIRSPETQRLPYLEEKQLAQGSFGTVFKVKIAKGHFLDPNPDSEMANVKPMDMARKDYRISDDFRAKDERDVMELILGISRKCETILENFGSIQIGDTYSLFMPLAICDLKMYMMSQDFHPMSPSTTEAKAELIRCAEGLADGLNFLHNGMDSMACYHMDLKPDNILIFRDRSRGDDREIWKLSDFGMARVKIRRPRDQLKEGERDFDRLFLRRKSPTEPSLSLTLNRRGEGTYLAPESISATPSMNTESDVWSLGCVISVLFVYFEGGSKGIQEYSEARATHKDAQGYDRFFLPGYFSHTNIHSAVRTMHKKLITQAKGRSLKESEAVRNMLQFLENKVLEVNPLKRCDANDFKLKLSETFDLFRGLSEPEIETARRSPRQEVPAPVFRPISPEKPKRHFLSSHFGHATTKAPQSRPGSSRRPISRGNVQEWYLSRTEDFKGGDISPDGTLIVLWTELKIVLYNSTSFAVREGENLKAGSEYRPPPETTNGFWKTMSVTQKFLIACETGANFNCYIFNLDHGTAVDANLEHWSRLILPLPQIHKIAISANSKRVACILQSTEGDKSPGTLFYADVADLVSAAKRPSIDDSSSISRPSISSVGRAWQMVPLEYPGADVTRLSFSNENDVHIVVQPEITGTSRVHRITIVSLSLDAKTMVPVNIEPRGLDPSSTVELFTSFAPFYHELGCAVVTREKRIHLLRSPDQDTPARDIPNYRVLELMMSLQDDVMYALGTSSANHNVLLLEIPIHDDQGERFEIKELAQLDGLKSGDKVTVNLSETGGERYVLVAALVSGSKRTVYRVRLP